MCYNSSLWKSLTDPSLFTRFSPWFVPLGFPPSPFSPPRAVLDHLWAHCRTIAWMVLYHLYAWTCPWPQPGSFNFSEPRNLLSGSMLGGMCNKWFGKNLQIYQFCWFSSKLGNGLNTGKIRISVRISTAFYGQNTAFVRVEVVVRTRYVQNTYFVRILGFPLKSIKISQNHLGSFQLQRKSAQTHPKHVVLYPGHLETKW